MYTCSDIKNFAKYISQTGRQVKEENGAKSIFVPFFTDIPTDNFKKSVVISSAYLDLFKVSRNSADLFKFNTAIPRIVEQSTGISESSFIFKCHNINNDIKKVDSINIDYSYLSNHLSDLFTERNI